MNYTQVHNGFFPPLMKITKASQIKILLCIIRYTAGFHRDEALLSASYISRFTGLTMRTVRRELAELEAMKLVQRRKNGECNINSVRLADGMWDTDDNKNTNIADSADTIANDGCDINPDVPQSTQKINNNIKKNIPNKECKKTHTRSYSPVLSQAVEQWCEIHNLSETSEMFIRRTVDKYLEISTEAEIAEVINRCISEGRSCIYFDRLKPASAPYDNPDLEEFTWSRMGM